MGSKPKISQNSQKSTAFPARWHKSLLKRQADQEEMRIAVIEQITIVVFLAEFDYQVQQINSIYTFRNIIAGYNIPQSILHAT